MRVRKTFIDFFSLLYFVFNLLCEKCAFHMLWALARTILYSKTSQHHLITIRICLFCSGKFVHVIEMELNAKLRGIKTESEARGGDETVEEKDASFIGFD